MNEDCSRNESCTRTKYVYDRSGEEVGENNRSGWTVRVIPFAGRHLAHYQGSPNAAYFVHTDKLGSTTQATDYTGAVAQDEIYYPWGQEWNMAGTYQEERFARLGHRDTTETGLDPTKFRIYASSEGRWFSTDPVGGRAGSPQSLNRYAYVLNHPINEVDPSGRFDLFGCDSDIEDCGCDPSIDPFCGLGGGGGGGCGVAMFVGDGEYCGPVLPPPPPPIPQPECFCQLKYHYAAAGYNHSYWYLQDSMGTQEWVSGEPELRHIPYTYFWVAYLNLVYDYPPDAPSNGTTWYDTGLSSDNCSAADGLVQAAAIWPNDTVGYNPLGPNSNSLAHWLAEQAGLGYVTSPPRAIGWYYF